CVTPEDATTPSPLPAPARAYPPAPAIPHPIIVAESAVPDRRGGVSFMSQIVRDGEWVVPKNFRAVTIMGNVELDLTQAIMGPGITKIEVVAIMSNVTVIVPPELRVECSGDPFMGNFEIRRQTRTTAGPDAPLVEITGKAIMSNINAVVIDPAAPN